jgi:hypothetical protein
MKNLFSMMVWGWMACLTGCATMNDNFSCNKTAGDACMSIDEVDAMTEPMGTFSKRPVFSNQHVAQKENSAIGQLWIAPHRDEQGRLNADQSIALGSSTEGRG